MLSALPLTPALETDVPEPPLSTKRRLTDRSKFAYSISSSAIATSDDGNQVGRQLRQTVGLFVSEAV